MTNLAGVEACDHIVLKELVDAGILYKRCDLTNSEVPYHFTGCLNNFTFDRAWTYWVVRGMMPYDEAVRIYDTEIGEKYIRVAGHCGQIHPDEGSSWHKDGKQVCKVKSKRSFEEFELDQSNVLFSDDPESVGAKRYVTCYHVDHQFGLNALAEVIKNLERK